jgi:hypothetical protein
LLLVSCFVVLLPPPPIQLFNDALLLVLNHGHQGMPKALIIYHYSY